MSRAPTPYEAEHERELAKHDFPPIARIERPISTAEDIAICVRALRNLSEGAALIEQYADMVAKLALAEAAEQAVKRLAVRNESPLSRTGS